MTCWTSPLPLTAKLKAHLEKAGLERWHGEQEAMPPVNTLVVYSSLDSVFTAALESTEAPPDLDHLLACYRQIKALTSHYPVCAAWRLEAMSPSVIARWLEGQSLPSLASNFPIPDPLYALFIRHLLIANPKLEDAYLDVEMNAELAGSKPDLDYWQRLCSYASDSQQVLDTWWQSQKKDIESRQVIEQLLGLRDEQEKNKERLLQENAVSKEEAAITKQKLHQAQEELEYYFLKAQAGIELAMSMETQLLRTQTILTRLISQSHSRELVRLVDVEVVPMVAKEIRLDRTVQINALLDSYANSLQKARIVLKRAIKDYG